jgi:hypothetical protein
MNIRRAPLLLLSLLVTACGGSSPTPPDAGAVTTIRSTTSFGFCIGYCRTTLDITSQGMVLVEESPRGDQPTRRRTAAISASEWQALVEAVDRRRIEAVPLTVGCPDCADGGAESLEVVGADWQRRVTFDFDARMPELQPLLDRVRALRQRFPRG